LIKEYWWHRPDLCYKNNKLHFSGLDVNKLASQFKAPTFLYSSERVVSNILSIKNALKQYVPKNPHKIYYAMKANRFSPLLTFLNIKQLCGIDACSPNEVELAMSCGFKSNEISFTACSLSKNDFMQLSNYDGLIMNCDSLHSIKNWGELKPGSNIGIRINPEMGTGRRDNDKLQYAGQKITKFGIYKEQFEEALNLTKKYKLEINRIHFHTGCGYLNDELDQWQKILKESLWFIQQCPSLSAINIGGGLGVPHTQNDQNLNLKLWAKTIASVFGNLNVQIEVEPGDYLVKDAGLLILEKTFIETKKNKTFIGVNAGFNIAPEPVYYSMPFEPISLINKPEKIKVSVVGNINEAMDVWYEDINLPDITDQDYLAIINSGAYSSSMASNHCMRGEFKEVLLI
jgi:diaminopimelate decarboxylase